MGEQIAADFGVYAFANFHKACAQQYYRIIVPLKALHDRGLANIYADEGKTDRDYAMAILNGADIALTWNMPVEAGLATAKSFREDMQPVMKGGALMVPPAFVFDMDDGIEYVHPLNNSFCVWGVRDWSGQFLKPGDSLDWPAPDGITRKLWEDKKTRDGDNIFDIERNFRNIGDHYAIAKAARGVTVTTEALAQLYREQGVEDVYVFPNSVIEEDYYYPNLMPHDGVRILWQGSSSHFEDWLPLTGVIPEIFEENPQAKLVIWGACPKWITKRLKPEQIEIHKWLDYAAYTVKRPLMDADINLCPLVDTPFNRCKSPIKWYEGSIGPRPEATIAANVGPYQEIEHGKTGLLYNSPQEFKEQLTALIRNAELRKTIASRAREWVLANRSARKTVVGLYDFYTEIKRKQRMEALLVT